MVGIYNPQKVKGYLLIGLVVPFSASPLVIIGLLLAGGRSQTNPRPINIRTVGALIIRIVFFFFLGGGAASLI